jgi:alanine racemase
MIRARWAWAEIDLGAIRHNVAWLVARAAPAEVWAVVKANGYGHGAVPVARTALEAGATGLCVALVDEGVELRRAGIAAPVLLLAEPPPEAMGDVARHGLRPTLYSAAAIEAAAQAVARSATGTGHRLPVHLKFDTGMRRVGAVPADATTLARLVADAPALELEGVMTHLAVADEPDRAATGEQLAALDAILADLDAAGLRPPLVHAANSAAAIAHPAARRSLVRTGIAVYGLPPSPVMADHCTELQPAMSLRSRVSFVKQVAAGDAISYGHRHTFTEPATVATVPLGYADGVPRRLSLTGGQVLIRGQRSPITGVVTMDQFMVRCPPDAELGDEVVLLGAQGDERITADEWAARLGTISYEIVCGIRSRVPRVHLDPRGPGEAGR